MVPCRNCPVSRQHEQGSSISYQSYDDDWNMLSISLSLVMCLFERSCRRRLAARIHCNLRGQGPIDHNGTYVVFSVGTVTYWKFLGSDRLIRLFFAHPHNVYEYWAGRTSTHIQAVQEPMLLVVPTKYTRVLVRMEDSVCMRATRCIVFIRKWKEEENM